MRRCAAACPGLVADVLRGRTGRQTVFADVGVQVCLITGDMTEFPKDDIQRADVVYVACVLCHAVFDSVCVCVCVCVFVC